MPTSNIEFAQTGPENNLGYVLDAPTPKKTRVWTTHHLPSRPYSNTGLKFHYHIVYQRISPQIIL